MAVINRNRVVTNGLLLNIDTFNPKSFSIPIRNISPVLTSWGVIRSTMTLVTGGTITPPITGAPVYKLVCGTSFVNTLHRLTSSEAIGTLGNGFYRYSMYVRGETTNNPTANIQIDISDNSGPGSAFAIIGTATTWTQLLTWDISGNYNSGNWFDFSFSYGSSGSANNTGDTYYISGLVIARSIPTSGGTINNDLAVLTTDPGYIPFSTTINTTMNDLSGNNSTMSLNNGIGYSRGNYGSLSFDGLDDTISVTQISASTWTANYWYKWNITSAITAQSFTLTRNNTTAYHNRIDLSLFYNIGRVKVDNFNNIYIMGQYRGYQGLERAYITKILSGGTIDTTFNANYALGGVTGVVDIIFDNQNNSYIVGTNIGNYGLSKIDLSGNTVSTFPATSGGGGPSINDSGTLVLDLVNQKMVVVGGWATTYSGVTVNKIAKINLSNLTPDTSFNTLTGFNSTAVTSIVADSNNDYYVGGDFTTFNNSSYPRIVKISGTTGLADTSFVVGSGFANAGSPSNQYPCGNGIKVTADGKILAAGRFVTYSGITANRIVKLNTDGTIDNTFTTGAGFNNHVNCLRIQPDNKILLGGLFTSYSGVTANRIIRLNSGGTIDNTFVTGSGFNTYINSIDLQSDGKILILTDANASTNVQTTYSGVSYNNLIRLNIDGSIDNTFTSGVGANLAIYRSDLYISTSSGNGLYGSPPFGVQGGVNLGARISFESQNSFYSKWHNICITVDSSRVLRFYTDGVLTLTNDQSAATNFNLLFNSMLTGANIPGACTLNLSNFSLYNRDLTQAEVTQNYNALRTRYNL
jgi:uncharacterized delta-60 repeat protein